MYLQLCWREHQQRTRWSHQNFSVKLEEAIALIKSLKTDQHTPQYWADLGCGSGLFSRALAALLPKQSHILCMDKDAQKLATDNFNEVKLEFIQADFGDYDFEGNIFNGILMANSLHYIQDKVCLIERLVTVLTPNGSIVIVEYDTEKANHWVPYPIPYIKLQSLLQRMGTHQLVKLGERQSNFGSMMYACEIIPHLPSPA